MVRNYQRKTVTKYSKDTLNKCINTVRSGKMTLRKEPKYFKIPYSTLHDKINKTCKKKSGGQNALADNLESYIVKTLDLLTTWKVPFDGYGVRWTMKSLTKKFKNNFPGTGWVCSFIQRCKLSKRITDNVKSSRAEVNDDVINAYFDNLENEITNIQRTKFALAVGKCRGFCRGISMFFSICLSKKNAEAIEFLEILKKYFSNQE